MACAPETTVATVEDGLSRAEALEKAGLTEHRISGFLDQPYLVKTPEGYDGTKSVPVLLALHGGGGNAIQMAATTCPGPIVDGLFTDLSSPECLHNLASDYLVVFPNGTRMDPWINARVWDAGGGRQVAGRDYRCTGGEGGLERCISGDSVEQDYFLALYNDLQSRFVIDVTRVFVTGISNGAAMSYRLACLAPEAIAGIAPVAGTNAYAANMASGEVCRNGDSPVPVLQIHGDDDPVWTIDGSPGEVFPEWYVAPYQALHNFHGVEGWIRVNGCRFKSFHTYPNLVDGDGTPASGSGPAALRVNYEHCSAPVSSITVLGGGHTWPNGSEALGPHMVGPVSRDISANRLLLEFFDGKSK